MSGQTYSAAYVEAIADERAMLRAMIARGEYDAPRDAPAFLANCESTLARGFCGPLADSLRGARDFWRGQVAKLASTPA